MKKSELFKKIYGNIHEISSSIGEAYHADTFMPEMRDEEADLGMPENSATFIEEAFQWYSCRLSRELAASLTEIISDFVKVEEDVNLFNPEDVVNLIAEVEG